MTMPTPVPLYLDPEGRPLAAFLHRVDDRSPEPDVGVVMVSPFGWDEIGSHRVRRQMAGLLSARGIPVLRYDLPATGDSAGGPDDPELLAEWIASVSRAADDLRGLASVARVCAFGFRLGGMLALAAACDGRLDGVIAWAPSARGKTLLRELRAFSRLEESVSAGPEMRSFGGVDAAGFRLSDETVAALDGVDLSKLGEGALADLSVLLLSRDDLPLEPRLAAGLMSAGAVVDTSPGPGFAEMNVEPVFAELPVETTETALRWLAGATWRRAPCDLGAARGADHSTSTEAVLADGVRERLILADLEFGPAFSVATEPLSGRRSATGVLLLNAGAVHHIGPNRLWVETARRLAREGVHSLRVDLEGIGESAGESGQLLDVEAFYRADLTEQAFNAVERMVQTGTERVMVIGLCSGAFQAFHVAARHPAVASAVMLNPRLFYWDPGLERERAARSAYSSLAAGSSWRKLLSGEVSATRIAALTSTVARRVARSLASRTTGLARARGTRAPHDRRLELARKEIERLGGRALLVFSDNEPLLHELQVQGQLPIEDGPPAWRLRRAGDAGHTFRPLWSQNLVAELIDGEMREVVAVSDRTAG